MKLWKPQGKLLQTRRNNIEFSPKGKDIVATIDNNDNQIVILQNRQEVLARLTGHDTSVIDIAFSSDEDIIASASLDKTVKLWNRQGNLWQTLKTLKSHNNWVISIAFSPNEDIIASASRDTTVKLWNLSLIHI